MSKTTITEPGVYNIPPEAYHADPCEPASLSSSEARKLIQTCPARLWHDKHSPPERSDALDFGSAVHDLLLEGEKVFLDRNEVLREDFNGRTKDGKALKAEIEGAGRRAIAHPDWEKIQGMLKALAEHPFAMAAFENGDPERSMFWRDPEFGCWRRARPDFMPKAGRIISDYKTARSVHPDDLRRDIYAHGYHQQAEWLISAVEDLEIIEDAQFVFVFQEKEPPYLVHPVTLTRAALAWGRLQNRLACYTFAKCLETGRWPGYAEDVTSMGLPGWAEGRLQEQHDAGLFDFWAKAQAPIHPEAAE